MLSGQWAGLAWIVHPSLSWIPAASPDRTQWDCRKTGDSSKINGLVHILGNPAQSFDFSSKGFCKPAL
jgi:hypothetical protein